MTIAITQTGSFGPLDGFPAIDQAHGETHASAVEPLSAAEWEDLIGPCIGCAGSPGGEAVAARAYSQASAAPPRSRPLAWLHAAMLAAAVWWVAR